MESMGMIRCEDALARLWDFLDGELPPEDETAVSREREQAPPSLRRRLFQRILEQEVSGGEGS